MCSEWKISFICLRVLGFGLKFLQVTQTVLFIKLHSSSELFQAIKWLMYEDVSGYLIREILIFGERCSKTQGLRV